MSTIADEKAAVETTEQPKDYSSSEDRPVTQHAPDTEAQAGGTYFVQDQEFNAQNHLKLARDGVTVLIPQPDDNKDDPLNWSWLRKHKVLVALLLPSLLTDWGMTWGTTLFEAQAVTWGMSVPDVARSVSGGIFLQGPGEVMAVPFVQRYGRLPVLFWSQVLGFIMVIIATFCPSYASFTAFRALQGFVATSPQVIGLSVVHDLFFFHGKHTLSVDRMLYYRANVTPERARKVNIWAFTFILGPFLGPFVSSFLLSKISWRFDMGVLAMFYGVSSILVVLLGEETLYDRQKSIKPTAGASKISILIGLAGYKAKGQTTLWSVTKHLAQLLIKPQLLMPTLYIMLLFTWAIGIVTTVTQFIRPPPYLLNDTQASLFYLAPITGAIVGEIWGHFFNDFLQNLNIRRHSGQFIPETRLWAVAPAAAIGVGAMVLYGQTLEKELPVIGLAAAWAMMVLSQVASTTAISAYALDVFPHHAALASSWINFWRTTGGFCVTYFQTQWVAKSGAAVTFGVQGAIIAFGFTFVVLTQIMGRKWRAKYPAPLPEN